jgi:hypothetical protein
MVASPIAYIEGIEKDGIGQDAKTVSVTLRVHYGQKQAQIELSAGEPRFDGEPGEEVFRRDLAELLKALQEAVASPQGVRWHGRF